MSKPIKVKVRDAENVIFEGEVDRISSYNEVGKFDIFPLHANFISIIRKGIELFKDHQKIKDVKIDQAILKVKQDAVNIYLGIETMALGDETNTKK